MVEGDAENILIPTIADLIGKPGDAANLLI